jgi:hypothetical protein
VRVTDPDGVEWEVSRQWLHVPRWWNRSDGDGISFADGAIFPDFDDELGIGAALVVLVVVVLLVLGGWVLLVMLAALLVAIGGLLVRILFRRPWLVRARSERGELEWRVRGAIGSRRAIHEVARALRLGDRSVMPKGAERVLPESPLQQFR